MEEGVEDSGLDEEELDLEQEEGPACLLCSLMPLGWKREGCLILQYLRPRAREEVRECRMSREMGSREGTKWEREEDAEQVLKKRSRPRVLGKGRVMPFLFPVSLGWEREDCRIL